MRHRTILPLQLMGTVSRWTRHLDSRGIYSHKLSRRVRPDIALTAYALDRVTLESPIYQAARPVTRLRRWQYREQKLID